jgi:hypothetical protein
MWAVHLPESMGKLSRLLNGLNARILVTIRVEKKFQSSTQFEYTQLQPSGDQHGRTQEGARQRRFKV